MKIEFSDLAHADIMSKANKIPIAFFDSVKNKLLICEANEKNTQCVAKRKFCEEMKIFAITLFSYSPKAYNFVRESFHDALPAVSTINTWLNKVDGSPGFSDQALKQFKHMASEKKKENKKVHTYILLFY